MRKRDLSGETFGRLTVLDEAERLGGYVMWLCRCECGTEKPVRAGHLTEGRTVSCGCYKRERTSQAKRVAPALTEPRWYDRRRAA